MKPIQFGVNYITNGIDQLFLLGVDDFVREIHGPRLWARTLVGAVLGTASFAVKIFTAPKSTIFDPVKAFATKVFKLAGLKSLADTPSTVFAALNAAAPFALLALAILVPQIGLATLATWLITLTAVPAYSAFAHGSDCRISDAFYYSYDAGQERDCFIDCANRHPSLLSLVKQGPRQIAAYTCQSAVDFAKGPKVNPYSFHQQQFGAATSTKMRKTAIAEIKEEVNNVRGNDSIELNAW